MKTIGEEHLICVRLGYQLGMWVAEHVFYADLGEEAERVVDYLERIAHGEDTPIPSGAEVKLKFPKEQDIEKSRNTNQRLVRWVANVILDWYQNMSGEDWYQNISGE